MDGYSRSAMLAILGGAALVGVVAGVGFEVGPNLAKPRARSAIATDVRQVAVATGIVRRRAPQRGDNWGGCNDARAAGTAPIYRDEPGYRSDMDGDDDGVACEPYPG